MAVDKGDKGGAGVSEFDDALDDAFHLLDEQVASARENQAQRLGGVDDRFKTRRVVTRSRNAWVLEAEHLVTGRLVALKVAFPNETSRARIRAEATALGAVSHIEGIVSVLDARVDGETASYIALEWLRGRSLEGILAARASLPPAAVIGLGSVIADTLVELHASDHVHGDLAPKHVFLTHGRRGRETMKLIDMGTSLLVPDATRAPDPWTAPEVAGSKPRTPASDVYALGALLARTLVGHPLTSLDELPKNHFGQVLARALDPVPTARPTAADFLHDLVRLRSEIDPRPSASMPAVQRPAPPVERPSQTTLHAQGAPRSQAAPVTQASPNTGTARPVPSRAQVQPHAPVTVQPPPSGEDLRKKARAGYVTLVRVTRADTVIDGRSEDVSESGLLLVLREPCSANEQIGIRFALPMDGLVASCMARVAWSRSHAGMPGMHAVGVELVDAPPVVIDAIAKYVKLMGVER